MSGERELARLCEREQLSLFTRRLDEPDLAALLESGVLRIEVDKPRTTGNGPNFVGCKSIEPHEPIQYVHVISKPAGGEIRGYVIARGMLCLRGPCYVGKWLEMDALVSGHLKLPIKPYRMNHSTPEDATHAR